MRDLYVQKNTVTIAWRTSNSRQSDLDHVPWGLARPILRSCRYAEAEYEHQDCYVLQNYVKGRCGLGGEGQVGWRERG
jgi:hypothetical protein